MNTGKQSLPIGSTAPDFTLPDERGVVHALSQYQGRHFVVLIFYPKDFTPGCTEQLCAVRDDFAAFHERNAVVLGINPGDAEEHQSFIARYQLKNPLLIDSGRKVTREYGAIGSFLGHETTNRTVVIVDLQGVIQYYKRGLPSNKELIDVLIQLQSKSTSV